MDDRMPLPSPAYWRYWGKTQPDGDYSRSGAKHKLKMGI